MPQLKLVSFEEKIKADVSTAPV